MASEEEDAGKVKGTSVDEKEEKAKGRVNFAAFHEVQDVRGTVKSGKSFGNKSASSFRQSFTGKGTAASRAAARRRRFWRKVKMRLNPRYWVHVANKRLPIIHPDAWYRIAWDCFVLILVLWNAILVPYQVGFSTPRPDVLVPLNYGIDILFAMDICFNYRTAYYDRTASLVRDGGRIFRHYSVTWFPVDLIATIPYEGLVLISNAELNETEARLIELLRLPRLLRLARLLRFFDRLRGANYVRMVKLTMAMGFMAHWVACAWRFLYEMTKVESHEWTYDQLGDGSAEITYFVQGYLQAFLTMIGNDIGPANDVERGFAIFIVLPSLLQHQHQHNLQRQLSSSSSSSSSSSRDSSSRIRSVYLDREIDASHQPIEPIQTKIQILIPCFHSN
ncbi:hypothetical protein DUNSADRAFT_17070 [Dunaliella salina]|uniref:Ion transport domain-containing protein n=1 Tax=Dunaliella salina TaxID=3046 RepID=A0ABQ7H0J1_DUNSA|nr:hypothetical protein DUNSADRAFT_17070 [Dunaliella salina]|eukprot:KAF5840372.1 hypothetical protein DUNSADRAFT_17070 [Dunaliella salina]